MQRELQMTNKVPLVVIVGGGFGGLAAAKALRSKVIPVSYTHLDVYKRQP